MGASTFIPSEESDDMANALGLCGCGVASLAVELTRDVLRLYGAENKGTAADQIGALVKLLGPEEAGPFWFVLYQLDHLGLTEHGTGIRFGWLTARGKEVLAWIEKHGCEPDDWPKREV